MITLHPQEIRLVVLGSATATIIPTKDYTEIHEAIWEDTMDSEFLAEQYEDALRVQLNRQTLLLRSDEPRPILKLTDKMMVIPMEKRNATE